MTPSLYPTETAIELPKLGSWPASVHLFDAASAYALRAAEAANRPLLVRGEPGTGKSQLARAAAVATDRLFLSVVVNARTECQDLQWHFDAVGRLGEAQTLARVEDADLNTRLHPRRFLSPGALWWALDWDSAQAQWETCANSPEAIPSAPDDWQSSQGSVLLIDEIDKADTDLPNSLLETLGNGDFTVPYTGASVRQSSQNPPPLVIMTTNEERELPDAFLRRCLVLHLSLPETDDALVQFLCQRGAAHFPQGCSEAVRLRAARQLVEDRNAALDQGLPPPGQAEYLDILRALSNMAQDEAEQLELLDAIRDFVLKKSPPSRP